MPSDSPAASLCAAEQRRGNLSMATHGIRLPGRGDGRRLVVMTPPASLELHPDRLLDEAT